jgi:hypothetical protein
MKIRVLRSSEKIMEEIKAHFAQAYVEELLKVRSAGSSDPCWSCQPVLAYLP